MGKKNWKPFDEAREWTRNLELNSVNKWKEYIKRGDFPNDIRKVPNLYKEWINWTDWLGSGYVNPKNKNYIPFGEAREWAINLNLKTKVEWDDYIRDKKIPCDIRRDPRRYDEWISWGDWLGTGNVHRGEIKYRPFNEARIYARSLGFIYGKQWEEHTKEKDFPGDIKKNPYGYDEWVNWQDWLGTKFIPFNEAREWARNLGLSSKRKWEKYTKRKDFPNDIRKYPYRYDEYISWGDWLGTGNKNLGNRKLRPFNEAREWARRLGINKKKDWDKYIKREDFPDDIRRDPRGYDEWVNWKDWLRTNNV